MENLNEKDQKKIQGGSFTENLNGRSFCPVCGVACMGEPTPEGKIKYECKSCKQVWYEEDK